MEGVESTQVRAPDNSDATDHSTVRPAAVALARHGRGVRAWARNAAAIPTMGTTIYQDVVDELNIEAATKRGSKSNDLLPERLEDSVAGEVGKRFSESLRTRMERGRYDPRPAVFVAVPKPHNTTRPAALLTLEDRVVYDGLVEALRPRIEAALLGDGIVLWPRGILSDKKWREFERAPLASEPAYIARTDVTGFYDCIDHEILRDTLISMSGKRNLVAALVEFLGRVMGSSRGVPQGLDASDPLATAYLAPVDAAMARESFDYFRHGDDVRIAASTWTEARRALFTFERELRRLQLIVNAPKNIVMKVGTYRKRLIAGEQVAEETRAALVHARVRELASDDDRLSDFLSESGHQELGWGIFYHGNVTFDDVMEALEPHLTPDDTEVAERVFRDAIARRPGRKNALDAEAFHQRLSMSLVRLAAARSAIAVPHAEVVLSNFPDKTSMLCNYLMALPVANGRDVVAVIIALLESRRFFTPWEKAWLLRVVGRFHNSMVSKDLAVVRTIAEDDDEDPFGRVEALRLLARKGECNQRIVRRIWNQAPRCFHPDLIAAVFEAPSKEKWCAPFIAGCADDPVIEVVLKQLKRKPRGSTQPPKPAPPDAKRMAGKT